MNIDKQARGLVYLAPEDLSPRAALLASQAEEQGQLQAFVDAARTYGIEITMGEDGRVVARRDS